MIDLEYDACKLIEAIVSDFLLPKECEMECIQNCITVNLCYIMINSQLTVVSYHVMVNDNHSVW